MLGNLEELEVDVVVVGGGGAGLRAAYDAAAAGAKVALVLKGRVTASGATAFGVAELAGFAVPDGAGDPLDSPQVHFDDIMHAGQGCNDARLVRILVDEAISAADDLDRWGVEFILDPNTGKPLVAMGDFASRPRNRKIYHHGKPITVALKNEIEKLGVTVIHRAAVMDLLRDDAGVNGVLAVTAEGKQIAIRAGATILATGGAGQMFNLSLMPPDITGDGYALAYRAGATMVNMEYMQAGFGTIKPALNIIMAWLWAFCPKFTDANGNSLLDGLLPDGVSLEQVMKTKVKHYPFSSSDDSRWLEIAAKKAMNEGRTTAKGGFLMDLRVVDESVLPKGSDLEVMWPISRQWLLKRHIDVAAEPLQIGLFGHSINGGLVISEHCESTVPGLFAVGETAGGPYGADRLGGNMLLNCQVFGKRAGQRAAEVGRQRRANAQGHSIMPSLGHLNSTDGKTPVKDATRRIKQIMTDGALIVRNERGLASAAQQLAALREEIAAGRFGITSVGEMIDLHEASSMLETGTMMVAAARLRKETRGSHYRDDFPTRDPGMAHPFMIRYRSDGPQVTAGTYEEVMP
jgi:fumarate reductase (CoM/CoB) subunit A